MYVVPFGYSLPEMDTKALHTLYTLIQAVILADPMPAAPGVPEFPSSFLFLHHLGQGQKKIGFILDFDFGSALIFVKAHFLKPGLKI